MNDSSDRRELHEGFDLIVDEYLKANPGRTLAETALRDVLEWWPEYCGQLSAEIRALQGKSQGKKNDVN